MAMLLQQFCMHLWKDIPTDADYDDKDEKDMALLERVLVDQRVLVRGLVY